MAKHDPKSLSVGAQSAGNPQKPKSVTKDLCSTTMRIVAPVAVVQREVSRAPGPGLDLGPQFHITAQAYRKIDQCSSSSRLMQSDRSDGRPTSICHNTISLINRNPCTSHKGGLCASLHTINSWAKNRPQRDCIGFPAPGGLQITQRPTAIQRFQITGLLLCR